MIVRAGLGASWVPWPHSAPYTPKLPQHVTNEGVSQRSGIGRLTGLRERQRGVSLWVPGPCLPCLIMAVRERQKIRGMGRCNPLWEEMDMGLSQELGAGI